MNQKDIDKLKNINILYVEDDKVIQATFGKILKKVFSSVIVASNGQHGLDTFKQNKQSIDFIITDINMPVMNGLEMFQEIKKLSQDVPCIVTTAHGEYDYFMHANEI